MPTDDDDLVSGVDDGADADGVDPGGDEGGGEGVDETVSPQTGQRLVRRPHRRPPMPPDPRGREAERPQPARTSRPGESSGPTHRRPRRRPEPATPTTPEPPNPVTNPAPQPLVATAATTPATPNLTDGNVLLTFEETIKLYPSAGQTISVDRKSGTPLNWMLNERPRTANELYAAIKRLHGRSPETTYAVKFQDGAGHGGGGLISLPSTLDDNPSPPGYPPPPYAPPSPQVTYAAPTVAPVAAQPPQQAAPLDANTLLTMQRQLFEMMQSMNAPRAAAPAAPPPPPTAPAPAPVDSAASMLAMQRQMFEMMQQMQDAAAGRAAPPPQPAPPPPAPAASAPVDQATTLLTMQKQMFEMMQQMQAAAAGHAPPAPQAPAPAPAAPSTDPTVAMLSMQRQMFEMMLTMMQTVQRGATPSPPPGAGPYRGPYRPHDPNHQPYDPRPPYGAPQPPPRPQSPSEQLRDAVGVMRSTFAVAREFQDLVGSPTAEQAPAEDDDIPVRVIDMGPAKGVINRSDGSLRGFETLMANVPEMLKWGSEQAAAFRKAKVEARAEERRLQQQQLPPGYVVADQDYQPPEGFVAVRVDQIPPQAQHAQPAQQRLQEPPDEMPPPIAESEPVKSRPWGMPPTSQG